jgi:pantetheine-phosphate adenylyltransferase
VSFAGGETPVGKTAVYPGTFDPLTNGHLDVIQRSLRIVDRLIVAVANNPTKDPLFTVEERLDMIKETTRSLSNLEVTSFQGLLIDFVSMTKATIIIRGVRAVSDFEYEFQMALMNRKLREGIETIFMMPHEAYSYLSSRLVKEVVNFGASVTGLVPPAVEKRLLEKFPPR